MEVRTRNPGCALLNMAPPYVKPHMRNHIGELKETLDCSVTSPDSPVARLSVSSNKLESSENVYSGWAW